MSRIGREPITIPAGVTVSVAEGNVVTVKGKLGEVTETFFRLDVDKFKIECETRKGTCGKERSLL